MALWEPMTSEVKQVGEISLEKCLQPSSFIHSTKYVSTTIMRQALL